MDKEEEVKDEDSSSGIEETGKEEPLTCSVLLTDYGYVVKMNVDQLFPLPEQLSGLRRQVYDYFIFFCILSFEWFFKTFCSSGDYFITVSYTHLTLPTILLV